jgi:hypothetical protein
VKSLFGSSKKKRTQESKAVETALNLKEWRPQAGKGGKQETKQGSGAPLWLKTLLQPRRILILCYTLMIRQAKDFTILVKLPKKAREKSGLMCFRALSRLALSAKRFFLLSEA